MDYVVPREHYDSLIRNPTPLEGGAGSLAELAASALQALKALDTATLQNLVITPEEYSSIIYPELGLYWGSTRDSRPQVVSFLKENHVASSRKSLPRLIRDFGDRDLHYEGVVPFDSTQRFKSYLLHLNTRVAIRTPEGNPDTIRAFGSVVEKDGRFKFLSYRDPD
jgi:hypothetical protein